MDKDHDCYIWYPPPVPMELWQPVVQGPVCQQWFLVHAGHTALATMACDLATLNSSSTLSLAWATFLLYSPGLGSTSERIWRTSGRFFAGFCGWWLGCCWWAGRLGTLYLGNQAMLSLGLFCIWNASLDSPFSYLVNPPASIPHLLCLTSAFLTFSKISPELQLHFPLWYPWSKALISGFPTIYGSTMSWSTVVVLYYGSCTFAPPMVFWPYPAIHSAIFSHVMHVQKPSFCPFRWYPGLWCLGHWFHCHSPFSLWPC